MAAVDKIEDQRKPKDFIGHRNRAPVLLSPKEGKQKVRISADALAENRSSGSINDILTTSIVAK